MKEAHISLHDPIAALATPLGTSALAVIRISGDTCIEKLDSLFVSKAKLSASLPNSIIHGIIYNPDTKEQIDEVMVAVFRRPKSYTGEDAAEISCHGSIACVAKILEILRSAGFRDAGPGEFTLRAFTNGKMDLTQAEAVNEIIHAQSDKARLLAFHRLSGKLSRAINTLKMKLVDILATIEIMIDYPDEEYEHQHIAIETLTDIEKRLSALADTFRIGKTFQEGAIMAIAGKTNAGKSTLFNLLVKEERSIVSEYHGTTRDFIEEKIAIGGIPIRLYDTAGFRTGTDKELHPVESEGIRRSENLISSADIILYLVDASEGMTPDDNLYLESHRDNPRIIPVWNKTDIQKSSAPDCFISMSCETQEGLHEIEKTVSTVLLGNTKDISETVMIDSQRQKEIIDAAFAAVAQAKKQLKAHASYDLIAFDIREAVNHLGMLTGEVTTSDILNTMFDNFCVGK
ncbi:MAG: tRNA uridine-5-carboxymethylaminomethyl(34) synthesis GTPase MnmE [Spirochaetales bacterium]|nr:tRNA uridine-5-carboxymethylaminomethyl(34) synthesis GTPase MnmE [Spirochaetales bacterium]